MAELFNISGFDFVVEIPPQFEEYVDSALLRLQVAHPVCRLSRSGKTITVQSSKGLSEVELRKAILHTIYREKIYAETLGMRQALVEAVTAR